jgi:hypothetical protein
MVARASRVRLTCVETPGSGLWRSENPWMSVSRHPRGEGLSEWQMERIAGGPPPRPAVAICVCRASSAHTTCLLLKSSAFVPV